MTAAPDRPDPDRLLDAVEREAARAGRGRLKIFFGAAAGVGKTYAMLEAARAARANGVDVVVGYVELHGRADTERLLDGLERLPPRRVRYRGVVRSEFDLDAALARRAAVTLVDELAHSNPAEAEPAPRHAKRWQDVEELRDAGLDVWTTLNVQHLESLNDVVAGITGARQQETLPDRVFDEADDIELIDLPPDDLLTRLRDGKVYVPERAGVALERFFRKPNLIALRELALRRTADRVDAAAREYTVRDRASRPWLARDRFIVAVAPDGQGEALVRLGKRFADALDAQWTVVSVETPAMQRLPAAERNRRIDVLRLAESLGAEAVTLDGPTPAAAILEYARVRHATRIVVGEPVRRGWRGWWRQSTPVALLREAHGIDVSVIARREEPAPARARASAWDDARADARQVHWGRYAWAAAISAACTAVAALMDPYFADANQVMAYLLGAAIAGLRLGRGPAVLTAVLNIACFNFFFIPPTFTFVVADAQYLVTFAVMLVVALTIATLMANVRQQTRVAGARERRTALLYAMSRELAVAPDRAAMCAIAEQHVAATFDAQVTLVFPTHGAGEALATFAPDPAGWTDPSVAQWVYDRGRPAGLGTDALPGTTAIYLPLVGSERALGVLAVLPANPRRVLLPEQRHLLETFAGQIALALERAALASAAESAKLSAETESLRNTLLASISHDLRTPLAVITGASSALADPAVSLDDAARARLAASIAGTARDMAGLVSNVLDLMRFEAGHVQLRTDWQSVEDLVAAAVARVETVLAPRTVEIEPAADLPSLRVDAALVVQALANLLENAARHTPPTTHVRVRSRATAAGVAITVEDDGPGLPPGDPARLFDKFQRGRDESDAGGAGLGLAICRAIALAHGGSIAAEARPGGGARFTLTLRAEAHGAVRHDAPAPEAPP